MVEVDLQTLDFRVAPLLEVVPPFSDHKSDDGYYAAVVHIALILDPLTPYANYSMDIRESKADTLLYPPEGKNKKPPYYQDLYDAYYEFRVNSDRNFKLLQSMQAAMDRMINMYLNTNDPGSETDKFLDAKEFNRYIQEARESMRALSSLEKAVQKAEFGQARSVAGRRINPLERRTRQA